MAWGCDYTGLGSSITSFFCNATTGNLSQSQVNDIKTQADADVAQASAGRQPSVVDALKQQVNADIDKVLQTFSLGSGDTTGALPSQATSLRVGGTQLTLANLSGFSKTAVEVGILVAAIVAVGYVAKSVRSIRG